MDQSLEVKNIKNEPTDSTSSDRLNPVKQETDCLVQSVIYIKTEPQEDENVFSVIAGTSSEMCLNDDNEFKMHKSIVNIKMENSEVKMMHDPLAVKLNNEIKVEEQFPFDLDQGESKIKTEPTKKEKDENFLESYDNSDSYWNDSNYQGEQLIRNNLDRKDKKYVCSECDKKFNKKCDFQSHLRIHIGGKPFTCKICQKSFNLKGNLNTHMLIHSGEKAYVCNVCKKSFNRKANLNVHKMIHSGAKPFSCNECDKSFSHKPHLVTHKRVHAGEKPFTCDVCQKAFAHTSTLTRHRRLHTGEKPYSCNTCNKSFAQKAGLNYHKQVHGH